MTIKELRVSTGMTQQEFAEYFNIPRRTIENWEGGKRKPPEYVIELIKYKLKMEGLHMNEIVAEAKMIMEGEYVRDIPNVDIGDEVRLADIWDGEGDIPESSYSYQIGDTEWINYEFEFTGYKQVAKTKDRVHYVTEYEKEEGEERSLDSIARITNIELL